MNKFDFSYELSYETRVEGGSDSINEFTSFPIELFDFFRKADFDDI